MHKIAENGIITLTAGDSLIAPLYLFLDDDDANRYTLRETDKLYFSLMWPHQQFENGVVRKIFTIKDINQQGDVVLTLDATDTESLPVGLYYYEIKLSIVDAGVEYVDTVVPKRKFYLV